MNLQKTELNSLGCFVKAAITEKEETMHPMWKLKDGLQAILLYQNASHEIKEVIDMIFLFLGSRHFNTLIHNYFKSVQQHEEYRKTYADVVALAKETLNNEPPQ